MNTEEVNREEVNREVKEAEECSICLEELDSMPLRILQCGHKFHRECVDIWLNRYYTCPYCREYEKNIDLDCYWLWLKPYGLSWFNKFFKYKYTLRGNYIILKRKNKRYRLNLGYVKTIRTRRKKLIFKFRDNKNIAFWFENVHIPFNALKKYMNELTLRLEQERIERQRIEQERLEQEHIQRRLEQELALQHIYRV